MQVGFTEKDRTILAIAANGAGGTIGEISLYSDIAKKIGLDDLDIDKRTENLDGETIENVELEKKEIKLLYSIMNRSNGWAFSKDGREAVKKLFDRLEKLLEE